LIRHAQIYPVVHALPNLRFEQRIKILTNVCAVLNEDAHLQGREGGGSAFGAAACEY
jgi:hypothetical protein